MDPFAQRRLRNSLLRLGKQGLMLAAGILISVIVFTFVTVVLQAATELHWLVGLIAALVILLILVWSLRSIRKAPLTSWDFGQYPRMGLALQLIIIATSATLAMAYISDILYQRKLVQYVSARPITLGLLLEYYGWHLIDSIPVFDIWSVFGLDSPAKSEGVLAKLLLQVFLVLVIASSIGIFRSKRGDFRYLLRFAKRLRERKTGLPRERALTLAQQNLDQAITLAKREGSRMRQIDAQLEYAHLLVELGRKKGVEESLKEARELIEAEAQDRDLDARRRAVQELQEKLEIS